MMKEKKMSSSLVRIMLNCGPQVRYYRLSHFTHPTFPSVIFMYPLALYNVGPIWEEMSVSSNYIMSKIIVAFFWLLCHIFCFRFVQGILTDGKSKKQNTCNSWQEGQQQHNLTHEFNFITFSSTFLLSTRLNSLYMKPQN
jgi:hypothetical protein